MTSEYWREYLGKRVGTYDFRTKRYSLVANELRKLGLTDAQTVCDVGSGMCEFGRYLYKELNWSGQYIPIDGSIDGTDLDNWIPHFRADYFVAIEVLEHLRNPLQFFELLNQYARKGVVITTPNADTLGEAHVLEMDCTHVTPIKRSMLELVANNIYSCSLFNSLDDTLVAISRSPGA